MSCDKSMGGFLVGKTFNMPPMNGVSGLFVLKEIGLSSSGVKYRFVQKKGTDSVSIVLTEEQVKDFVLVSTEGIELLDYYRKEEAPIDMNKIRDEVGEWAGDLFPERRSAVTGQILGPIMPLLGIVEEAGELCGTVLKYHQNRRGFGPSPEGKSKYESFRDDAIADIQIFLADFCSQESVDMPAITKRTWDKIVKKRNLQNWEEYTHETPPVLSPAEQLAQNGQGFAEPPTE